MRVLLVMLGVLLLFLWMAPALQASPCDNGSCPATMNAEVNTVVEKAGATVGRSVGCVLKVVLAPVRAIKNLMMKRHERKASNSEEGRRKPVRSLLRRCLCHRTE